MSNQEKPVEGVTARSETVFHTFGHNCELQLEDDIVYRIIPGSSRYSRFRRAFRRFFMLDGFSLRCRKHLRSEAAIKKERLRHITLPFCVIHPFSRFRIWWECFYGLYILCMTFLLPFNICLLLMFAQQDFLYNSLLYFGDFISIIDVILKFLTGRCRPEIKSPVDMNLLSIARQYIASTFFIDLIASCAYTVVGIIIMNQYEYDVIILSWNHKVLLVIAGLGIFRFPTVLTYLKNASQTFAIPYIVSYHCLSMLRFLMCIHWLCMAQVISFSETPWTLIEKLSSFSLANRYIICFYRVIRLMSQLGILNYDKLETWDVYFSWFLTIIGRLLIIAVIAFLVQTNKGSKSSSTKYETMMNQLRVYIWKRQLPPSIERRMIRHYEYKFRHNFFNENLIIKTVGGQLRSDITMHNCRWMLERVEFFKMMPIGLLLQITSMLKNEIYLVNEMIARAGRYGDSMFFITSGTVAIYTIDGQELYHLEDGDYFGEVSMLTSGKLYDTSAVAATECNIYTLERADFDQAILPYPDLVETLEKTAKERSEILKRAQFTNTLATVTLSGV